MNAQPEALWLSKELEAMYAATYLCDQAAAELRRLHEENEALRQALAQISPSDYALIHKDALRAWGKLGELEAACCYSMQPEQEPSKQFNEWACAEHQKILAESANSTTSVAEPKTLAQPEQEPVAWMFERIRFDGTKHGLHLIWKPEYMDAMSENMGAIAVPLYTAPSKREWVSATHIEIGNLWATHGAVYEFAMALDNLLKEKNT